MANTLKYKITGINGIFRIPIEQNDNVNAISTLVKKEFSIIPKLSAKVYGSYLQNAAILSKYVRKDDIVTFYPTESDTQLTMSQQIIITPRYQSKTAFIVFSTINFKSMTAGDKIQIDINKDTKSDIEMKILKNLNAKYHKEIRQKGQITKILLFLPGGIPFFDGATINQFIQSFPDFLSYLYSIVIFNDNISDSILNETIDNICNISNESFKALLSPYFESDINGLGEIAAVLGYIQNKGPNSNFLIHSIAKFCPFAPLINGLFGLSGHFTGSTVIQITAPLSVLFIEMSKNLPEKTNLFSSTTKFLSFFMSIKISDKIPCTEFSRPFYNIGYESFFHSTIENETQIDKIIAFNPDFENYDWIRFSLPSLTEEDFKFAMRSSKELKKLSSLYDLDHVSLLKGRNCPFLFLSETEGMIVYINPEVGQIEIEPKENLACKISLLNFNSFDRNITDIVDPKKVTQITFFCICKSQTMNELFDNGVTRFVASQKLAHLFRDRCYANHILLLAGSIMFNSEIHVKNELTPLISNFSVDTETPSGDRAIFQAVKVAAEKILAVSNKYKNAVLRIIVLCDGEDAFANSTQMASVSNFLLQNNIKVDSFFFDPHKIPKNVAGLSHFTGGVSVLLNSYKDASDMFTDEAFTNVRLRKFGRMSHPILVAKDFSELRSIGPENLDKTIEVNENEFAKNDQIVITPTLEYIEFIADDPDFTPRMNRIVKEIKRIVSNPSSTFIVFPLKERFDVWRLLIKGCDSSLYENKWFYLIIEFDDDYPTTYPKFRFVHPPYHPNINDHGLVQFDLLYQNYRSDMSMIQLIEEILVLFIEPKFDSAIDSKRAGMRMEDPRFLALVDEWNQKNGKDSPDDWTKDWNIENPTIQQDTKIYEQPIYATYEKDEENRNKDEESSDEKLKILDADLINKLLTKKTCLGRGATSTVYRVNNCFTHKGFLCLKILNDELFIRANEPKKKKAKTKSIWDDDDDDNEEEENEIQFDFDIVKRLYSEYEMLCNLDHPNIVKVYGFFLGDKEHNPAILLEYCKFDLEKVIKELEDVDLVGIIYEICSAMKYVHENDIIHRDLKMKNILINNKKHVKICDFGISKFTDVTTYASITRGVGTPLFMAPEIFDEKVVYNEKVDVYAFGVVMYFIVTKGELPKFNGIGKYEFLNLPSSINQLSSSIIKSCWSSSPEERPSFERLLELITENDFMLIDGIENQIPKLKEHLKLD